MLSSDMLQNSQSFLPVFERVDLVANDDDVFAPEFFTKMRSVYQSAASPASLIPSSKSILTLSSFVVSQ